MLRQWELFPPEKQAVTHLRRRLNQSSVLSHLKIRHFPDSNAKVSIGTVRKQRFASAGCCRIMILDAGLMRCFGKPGHQHTVTGLLQWNMFKHI